MDPTIMGREWDSQGGGACDITGQQSGITRNQGPLLKHRHVAVSYIWKRWLYSVAVPSMLILKSASSRQRRIAEEGTGSWILIQPYTQVQCGPATKLHLDQLMLTEI